MENCVSAYIAYRSKKLQYPKKLIEEIDSCAEQPPKCPVGNFKIYVRLRDSCIQENITCTNNNTAVKIGTSPAMTTDGSKLVQVINKLKNVDDLSTVSIALSLPSITPPISSSQSLIRTTELPSTISSVNLRKRSETARILENTTHSSPPEVTQFLHATTGRHIILTPYTTGDGTTMVTQSGQRLTVVKSSMTQRNGMPPNKPVMKVSPIVTMQQPLSIAMTTTAPVNTSAAANTTAIPTSTATTRTSTTTSATATDNQQPLAAALAQQLKCFLYNSSTSSINSIEQQTQVSEFLLAAKMQLQKERHMQKLQFIAKINQRRIDSYPVYGIDLRESIVNACKLDSKSKSISWFSRSFQNCTNAMFNRDNWSLTNSIKTYEERIIDMHSIFNNFVLYVPAVSAPVPCLHVSHPQPSKLNENMQLENIVKSEVSPKLTLLHPIISSMSVQVIY